MNRLTNELRDALTKLPVWSTEEDRRRALSYSDKHLEGIREAVEAVRCGRRAPTNLGVLVAIARYEGAGWMPDGCFEQWRRQELHGSERLGVAALVQWLGKRESDMQHKLHDLESDLTNQCIQQEDNLATFKIGTALAHQRLHAHHLALILARLSSGDTAGAREIAQRVPAGSARAKIDKILHEHAALSGTLGEDSPGNTPSGPDAQGLTPRRTTLPQDLTPSRGLQLLRRHLDDGGHAWDEVDVQAARKWISEELKPRHAAPLLDALHRIEIERLDALRRAEIEGLDARRHADPSAEEREALQWLKQHMRSVYTHRTVLIALADRLLGTK